MSISSAVIEQLIKNTAEQAAEQTLDIFTKRQSSIGLLTDPKVLAHLLALHRRCNPASIRGGRNANDGEIGSGRSSVVASGRNSEVFDLSFQRELLARKIAAYNRNNAWDGFQVVMKEGLRYEGVLRFCAELRVHHRITKALRISNHTTVSDLVPLLRDKIKIPSNVRCPVFQVQGADEILLSEEECPLDIAVESKRKVRFVLKVSHDYEMAGQNGGIPTLSDSARHKMLSKFFGVNSSELSLPYSQSLPLPHEHIANGFDSPRSDTHSNSDAISLSSSNSSNSSSFSSGQRKLKGQRSSMGANGVTGLILKPQTPRFKRKSPSTGHEHRSIRPPNRTQKRRHRPKSLTLMLERSLSLKRRQNGNSKPTNGKELSTEETAPGVLKVFGDSLCPGSNYKSVLASARSSAVELIKEILSRYSLPRSAHREYVLCDVIGKFVKDNTNGVKLSETEKLQGTWIEECVRPIADNERPLILQSFWKPGDGLVRRFEVRRRQDLPQDEIDIITSGINKNARRLQMSRSHAVSTENSLDRTDTVQNGMDFEDGFFNGDLASHSSPRSSMIRSNDPNLSLEREETESSDEPLAYNVRMPSELPYLLTLHGYDSHDLLLHTLTKDVMLVGNRNVSVEEVETEDSYSENVDIALDATDVLPQHCWIFRQQRPHEGEDSREDSREDCEFVVRLEPVEDALVIVNGMPITGSVTLNPGDFVCFGHHYAFMYKDPVAPTLPNIFPWCIPSSMYQRRWVPPNQFLALKAKEYGSDKQRIKLLYRQHDEDQVLGWIGHHLEKADSGCPLGFSYLLCCMVEYAAYHFHQTNVKALILKSATLIQGVSWDTTKGLANRPTETPDDVHATMATLLPDLRLLLICMANALELLNFYQNNLHNYIAASPAHAHGKDRAGSRAGSSGSLPQPPPPPPPPAMTNGGSGGDGVSVGSKSPRDLLEEGEQEVLSILEEVMMYTFQQCVYYLTKTLYVVLPAVLDSNPFLDDSQDGRRSPGNNGMEKVLYVFQSTYDLLQEVGVHQQITSQLFAYLLFFTNASLFNMLMERGVGGKFFKWSKGAQIRGNLDLLELWIHDKELQLPAKFLQKVSTATDLLATPKLQLAQAEWSSIRRDFPALNAAQIHQILSEYDIGGSQASRPRGWFPPPKEVEAALRTEDVLVSFDDHPPLVLPSEGFKLDLRCEAMRLLPGLMDILHALQKDFPKIRIKTDIADVELPIFDEEDSVETTFTDDTGSKDKQITQATQKVRTSSSSSWAPNEKDAGAILDDLPQEAHGRESPGESRKQEKCLRLMQELEHHRSEVIHNNVRNIRARPNIRRITSLSSLPDTKPVRSHPPLVKSVSCPITNLDTRSREMGISRTVMNSKDKDIASGNKPGIDDHKQDTVGKGSQASHCVKPILKNKKPKTHRMGMENGISHIAQDVIPEEDGEVFVPPMPSPASQHVWSSSSRPRTSSAPCPPPPTSPTSPTSPMHARKPTSPPPPPPKPRLKPPVINGHHLPRSPPPAAKSDLKVGVIAPPAGFDSSPEEAKRKEQRRLKETGGGSLENGGRKEKQVEEEGEEVTRVSVAERVEAAERMEALSSNMSNNNVDLDGEALEELLKGIDSQDHSDLSFWQDDRPGSESTASLATPESWTAESPHSDWSSSSSSFRERKDSIDDVFVVDLEKGDAGLGLGLVDGQHTVLKSPGIYICKILPGGSANQCRRLRVGDRILAVNGSSLVGSDYDSAMTLIMNAGNKLRILVGKSDNNIAMKITASSC